jgi:arabinofuranosyltransferase
MKTRKQPRYLSFHEFVISQNIQISIAISFTLIIGFLVFYKAWISDDAMITLRTILNWHHGFGLVFNPGERVQGYTHPLWMLLLSGSYLIIHEIFLTTLILSTMLTMIAAFLIPFYFSKSLHPMLIACFGLIASKAFLEYGTSGLENSISYGLMGFLVLAFLRQNRKQYIDYYVILTLASLLFLCRMDYSIIAFPIVLTAIFACESLQHKIIGILLGSLPVMAWMGFALIYYGTPFPNTYYAKLSTEIPKTEYFLQGLNYTLDLLTRDLSTGLLIGIALWMGSRQRNQPRLQILTLSLGLYLLYILSIGGDFMSGRFFAILAYLAAIIIAQLPELEIRPIIPVTALIFGIGISGVVAFSVPNQNLFYPNLHVIRMNGVADERIYLFDSNALIGRQRQFPSLENWRQGPMDAPKQIKIRCGGLGHSSLADGPQVHYIDTCALTDPLLARLPYYRRTDQNNHYGIVALWRSPWRIGHFTRLIPNGYYHTIQSQTLQIDDPQLAEFYQSLQVIIQGPLFTPQRLVKIWQLNTGQLDHLIDRDRYSGSNRSDLPNPPLPLWANNRCNNLEKISTDRWGCRA